MPKYLIIGASAAGIGAVEAIREVDPVGEIMVISEEPCPKYSRPMISDYVTGKVTIPKMMCREDDFWSNNKVEALTGKTAIALNSNEKYVILDQGERINYEKLLIATGGKPFVPKMEGVEKDGVFTFTNISDAERLSKKLENSRNVVVIGAGLIGISVTEALVKRGLKVTIVELQEKILSLLVDSKGSEIIETAMKKAGVNIITGQSVLRIVGKPENNQTVGGVFLTNGQQLSCDVVIVAIGVIPRIELVAGKEVKLNRGIVVDSCMQTSVSDVYASGDVAETWDFALNQNRLLPLWPLAVAQGKIAGYNMAGHKTEYAGGTNMSSLKYFGVPVVSIGISNPKDETAFEVLISYNPEKNIYKKVVLKDNVIVGITLVNDIERAGTLFYLMKNRVNIKKFKRELISEAFGLAMLPIGLRRTMGLGCA